MFIYIYIYIYICQKCLKWKKKVFYNKHKDSKNIFAVDVFTAENEEESRAYLRQWKLQSDAGRLRFLVLT